MLRTLATVLVAAVSLPAHAATLDFTQLGFGDLGAQEAMVDGARITSDAASLYVGAGPNPNSICAYDPAVFSCANDLEITFEEPVTNLSFDHGTWEPDELVEVLAFREGSFLGSTLIESPDGVDLSGFGEITMLNFLNVAGNGTAYANFSFDVAGTGDPGMDVAPVPLPTTFTLMLGALFLIAAIRRRQSASQALRA